MHNRSIEHSYFCEECDRHFTDAKLAADHAKRRNHDVHLTYNWRERQAEPVPLSLGKFYRPT